MKSEAISIEKYMCCDLAKRFDFIYENYSILQPMIRNYKEELIADVIDMKECKRRAEDGDLGVRIQVSIGVSRTTESKALANITIEKAIDEGYLDEEFLEDIDDSEQVISRVTLYHTVIADYETFRMKLDTLNLEDQRILKPYLMHQKTMTDLAKDLDIDYGSAIKRIYRIRKRLRTQVAPRLRKGV